MSVPQWGLLDRSTTIPCGDTTLLLGPCKQRNRRPLLDSSGCRLGFVTEPAYLWQKSNLLLHQSAIRQNMDMALQKFARGATHYCNFKHTALCENALHYDNKTIVIQKILCTFKIIFFQRSKNWHTPSIFRCFALPFSVVLPLENKYYEKRSFLSVVKSWKVALDRVPWFGRHENMGEVFIYPVLVEARTVYPAGIKESPPRVTRSQSATTKMPVHVKIDTG